MNQFSQLRLLGEVARTLNCKPYKIAYLLSAGIVPEPALRLGGRRVFTVEDIERITAKLDGNRSKHD